MSQDVSELMDGESDEYAAKRTFAGLRDDAAARGAWERYHLIGDAMRGTAPMANAGAHQRLQARVFAALAAEPTVLVPPAKRPAPPRAWMRYSVAAAATLAAFGLFAWLAPLKQELPAQVADGGAGAARALQSAEANGEGSYEDPYLEAHLDVSPAIRPGIMRASLQAPAAQR